MELHKISLQILTPTSTPWQSDTIFGHICWQVAFGGWEQSIEEFLQPFLNGDPPFVLSDGFPDGILPRPVPYKEKRERFNSLQEYAQAKKRNKPKYLSQEDFKNICNRKPCAKEPEGEKWQKMSILHAAIDRNTGTTSGTGQLFETEIFYLNNETHNNKINIYLLCEPYWRDNVIELLEKVSVAGYGKDKSVGCGRFRIIDVENAGDLLKVENPNGFTTLSSHVPASGDPINGRWKIRTKYGKLGEGAGKDKPFKRPLLQFEPGAVFKTDNPKSWYGRMVRGVAPDLSEVVQCGYTIAIPLRLDHFDPLFEG